MGTRQNCYGPHPVACLRECQEGRLEGQAGGRDSALWAFLQIITSRAAHGLPGLRDTLSENPNDESNMYRLPGLGRLLRGLCILEKKTTVFHTVF